MTWLKIDLYSCYDLRVYNAVVLSNEVVTNSVPIGGFIDLYYGKNQFDFLMLTKLSLI